MKNQNLIAIKKVSEERYFKNHNELYTFVEKMNHTTIERMCDMAATIKSYTPEILKPLSLISKSEESEVIKMGRFICLITKGNFIRTSGLYKYNLLAILTTDKLTGYDLQKIFSYE